MKHVVGVIDNGLLLNFFSNLTEIRDNILIDASCNIITEYQEQWLAHGTLCAAIIRKYAPQCEIISVSLKGSQNHTSVKQLITAINLLVNMNIRLINISMGTVFTSELSELKECTDKAYENGCIIVASAENNGLRSYPAFFDSVIGIAQTNSSFDKPCGFVAQSSPFTGVSFLAKGIHQLEQCNGSIYTTPNAASFSTSFMTAKIFNLMLNDNLVDVYSITRCAS